MNRNTLDFTVNSNRLYYGDNHHSVPGKMVLSRSDNNEYLGIVSQKYKVVQPADIIDTFSVISEENGSELVSVGTEKGKLWALAESPHKIEVDGDQVGCYLLFLTSFDGTTKTIVKTTTIRVVCQNVLTLALRQEIGVYFELSHRHAYRSGSVKIEFDDWFEFEKTIRRLKEIKMSPKEALTFFGKVVDSKNAANEGGSVISSTHKRILDKLMGAWYNAPGNENTAWGALNAVSYHETHGMKQTKMREFNGYFKNPLRDRALAELVELAA